MKWGKKDIISYYERNEFGYGLWGKNMHFGYWDKSTKTIRQATKKFNEVIVQKASINEHDRVLDAGCGVGGASVYLAKKIGCHVTGITICPRQVGSAKKNSLKEKVSHLTEFFEMDYMSTEFPENSFDVVWGLESICYAENKEKFIQEAYRILNPGGRLIIADGFASKQNYFGIEKRMMNRWLDGWIVNYLDTPDSFKLFARKAGFNNIDYKDVTENVFRTSQIMYYASFVFLIFHLIDKVYPLKSYPTDAMFHQFRALKRGLWQYGIFYAEK